MKIQYMPGQKVFVVVDVSKLKIRYLVIKSVTINEENDIIYEFVGTSQRAFEEYIFTTLEEAKDDMEYYFRGLMIDIGRITLDKFKTD